MTSVPDYEDEFYDDDECDGHCEECDDTSCPLYIDPDDEDEYDDE